MIKILSNKDTDLSQLDNSNLRIAVLASEYNYEIVDDLIDAAIDTLIHNNINIENIKIVRVPGAYEIPIVAQNIAMRFEYDAIIALACIIRGETEHFRQIVDTCNHGILQVMLEEKIPIINGVLAVNNIDQAIARSGKKNNKGKEAAIAAIKTANLIYSE